MRKTFHLCLSAGSDGLLCRREDDYVRMVNCIGLAAKRTDTILLAYSVMSNHLHMCVRTECHEAFIRSIRYMYTRYFNNRYYRKGRLGEKRYFVIELKGLHHILTAIAYVLRNPLHHGVSPTPFAYKYSSVNAAFRLNLGKTEPIHIPLKSMYRFLPEPCDVPDSFRMDESGMLIPDYVVDVAEIEHLFATPRSYLYYMNRLSGAKWEEEQKQDRSEMPPLTLSDIEKGVVTRGLESMLISEYGKSDYNSITDIRLCAIVDDLLQEKYGVSSIYELSVEDRSLIAAALYREYRLPKDQLSRCMVL